jgi:hypothetical protein
VAPTTGRTPSPIGCEAYTPRDLPMLVEELYDLSTQEWIDLGLAFAYGQRIKRKVLEDLHDFRTRYSRFFIEDDGQSFAAKILED